jgi:hypothetical protein
VSVPVWGATLSGPLPVAGLVSRYLTNYLMGRRPLLKRSPLRGTFGCRSLTTPTVCGISSPFGLLFPTSGQVTYVLRTHSPLRANIAISSAFDLHVLSTPPAFILSQDQTLRRELRLPSPEELVRDQPWQSRPRGQDHRKVSSSHREDDTHSSFTLVCFLSQLSC